MIQILTQLPQLLAGVDRSVFQTFRRNAEGGPVSLTHPHNQRSGAHGFDCLLVLIDVANDLIGQVLSPAVLGARCVL